MTDVFEIKGLLTNYGFCFKKALYHYNCIHAIKLFFSVKPEQLYEDKTVEKEDNTSFEVFVDDDIYIVIPKFIGGTIQHIKFVNIDGSKYSKINFKITKKHYKYEKSNFEFIGKLRDYQIDIINTVLKELNIQIIDGEIKVFDIEKELLPTGGIIQLSVGMGKTLLAIFLAHLLKLKTLIIVNQEFLQNQWIERFKTFTTAKIGRIQGKIIDILDKDVVIGMVQSISMKEYEDDVFKQFGLVIYDEVHHYGSRVFSQALMKTACKYTIGLTATLERSDGMVKIINWFVGNTICRMERDRSYRVLVKKINFRSTDKLFVEKKRWITGSIKPDHKTMVNNILGNYNRNKLIINMINNLKSRGRTIFIISEQIKHLEILKNGVDELIKEANEQHIYNTYYYIGQTKAGEKKMAENDGHIIFATIQLASEALDIPRLDTIILTNPIKVNLKEESSVSDTLPDTGITTDIVKKSKKKRITQTIGRILRTEHLHNLTDIPLVIDLCDIVSIYQGWGDKREEYYYKNNWFVQHFNWNDETYIYRGKDDKTLNPFDLMFNDIEDEEFIKHNLILHKK
jgi:superfamily II DNA or RNA helicase